MIKLSFKIVFILLLGIFELSTAQFRPRDRMDNMEDFDERKYTWGFFLNANNFDYRIVLNPKYGVNGNENLVESKSTYSFGAGLIGRMRLNQDFDLRVEPGLQFVEREILFKNPLLFPLTTNATADGDLRRVKSTYVDIPVLLEFHGQRWYNSRAYAAAGLNYMVNLQSNSNSEDDNLQGIFRSTTHNFAWSAELGIQFYFKRFKLTPAFRGTFMMNNEIVSDNPTTAPYWAGAISTMHTRALMFVLKFE